MLTLLADFEWTKWIGLIVFIVIYILNHFLGGDKNKAQAARAKAAGPKPADRTPQPAAPNRPAAATPARRSQSQEIDAFLQRAKDRKREKTPSAKPVAKAPPPPPRRLAATPVEAEVVKPRKLGAAIANKQIDTREVTEHAEHLTDDLSQADQMRELHRRKMFGHRVGNLEDTSGALAAKADEQVQSPTTDTTAANVAPQAVSLFRPQDIRQAIIVSEVLQRPEHRW